MSCYHPLKGIPVGINLETGKTRYSISKLKPGEDPEQGVIIPCGQCLGCRLDYARQWADRCMLESKYHDSSYFLTLTYDDEHLDDLRSIYTDPVSGESHRSLSLRKKHMQQWHKDLRKALDKEAKPKIRFFGCGEYGSETFRPHLHEIVFGLVLDDLKFYKYNKQRQPLYTSEWLNKIWKKGYVIVGEVSWDTCAYVARYVVKKQKGESALFYMEHNIEPPFTLMSRRPGIGRQYLEDHPDFFDYSYHSFGTEEGSRKIFPPRYFKQILQDHDESTYVDLKANNLASSYYKREALDETTDLDYLDYLAVQEHNFKSRVKSLTRKEV